MTDESFSHNDIKRVVGIVGVALSVVGVAIVGIVAADGLINNVLKDDFDDGELDGTKVATRTYVDGPRWALIENGTETDECGSITNDSDLGSLALTSEEDETHALDRRGSGYAEAKREARTVTLNATSDGTISFSRVHMNSECFNTEVSGIYPRWSWVEYSTDGGDTWSAIGQFRTSPWWSTCNFDGTCWRDYDFAIPEPAQTSSTQFRIAQYVHGAANTEHGDDDDLFDPDADVLPIDRFRVRQVTTEDADTDDVPDTLEHELCDRYYTRKLLQSNFGECQETSATASGWDYVPAENMTVSSPERFQYGQDTDGDNVTRQVNISFTGFEVQPTTGETDGPNVDPAVNLSPRGLAEPVEVTLEPDDGDPNRPVESTVCSRLNSATGIEQGTDDDDDGFPDEVEVAIGKVCVDTADPWPPEFRPIVTESHRTIDADDSDPTVPGTDTVTTDPVGLSAAYGQDKDDDGFPSNVTVYWQNVTVDADGPDRLGVPFSNTTQLDPDDADPDIPESGDLLGLDDDDDLIVDALEDDYCDDYDDGSTTADGYCQSFVTDNYVPSESLQNAIGHLAS